MTVWITFHLNTSAGVVGMVYSQVGFPAVLILCCGWILFHVTSFLSILGTVLNLFYRDLDNLTFASTLQWRKMLGPEMENIADTVTLFFHENLPQLLAVIITDTGITDK